jgi:L-alanine-DL-glutamate epimerase-like enolase superfamily enzyme
VSALADAGVPAINLKTMKSSVLESHAMWQVAKARGLRMMIGGMVESRLSMAFSAHFAAGLGGVDFVDLDTPLFVKNDPFTGGYTQAGARMTLGDEPGHGVRWR